MPLLLVNQPIVAKAKVNASPNFRRACQLVAKLAKPTVPETRSMAIPGKPKIMRNLFIRKREFA